MRNVTKLVLLACTVLAVFTSCNVIADTSGLVARSGETQWIQLTPSAPVLVGERWTAEVVLDFSKPVAVLKDDMSEEELNTFITFDYQNYPVGTGEGEKLRATSVKKIAGTTAMWTLTVVNIPSTSGIARVVLNSEGITPAYRPWSFDGRVIPDLDMSAAMLDFRFERSNNPTLSVDEVVGGIDQWQGTVFVVAPLHTILNPLTPTITTNIGNTFTPEAQTNFTESVNYIVKSPKTAAEKEYIVRVIPQELKSARIYVFAFIKEENYTRRSLTLNANTADGLAATVYGIIDEEASPKTIAVTVPFGTDVSALLPNITHSGESIAPAHLEAQDFTAPVKYTVKAADGAEFDYWVTVTVNAAMPTITEFLGGTFGLSEPATLSVRIVKEQNTSYSFKWYSNATNSNSGGTLLGSSSAPSYELPAITSPGVRYYYVEVSATVPDGDPQTATSETAEFDFRTLEDRIALADGAGSAAEPEPIILYQDETLPGVTAANISGAATHIVLTGSGAERKLTLSSAGNMFWIGASASLALGNNVTLVGRADNTNSLVYVFGASNKNAQLTMESGSKITGNNSTGGTGMTADRTSTANGGAVNVNCFGIFNMKGGEISGNTGTDGGGVYVGYVTPTRSGAFNMSGGIVSGNTATSFGGGVYLGAYVVSGTVGFSKTGNSIIYGNTGTTTANTGSNGHAMYRQYCDGAHLTLPGWCNVTIGENESVTWSY